jgi:hypothetical protein
VEIPPLATCFYCIHRWPKKVILLFTNLDNDFAIFEFIKISIEKFFKQLKV